MTGESQQGMLFDDALPEAGQNGNGRRGRNGNGQLTSKQQLSTMIKSVRDLLRKDAGLYGDTDRLPQLTWLLFLKLLDDFEVSQEEEHGAAYDPVLAPEYRWRTWAAIEDVTQRKTGDELIEFVNNSLIPYLAQRSGPDARDIRTIVGAIFQGIGNRIRSGYILRDVVNKLSTINFNASDDIHTMSHFYETMLREMRDAAGDAGEFYTPRPVVRFIIDRLNPRLGERVLDPACGTGGFLVETWEHLKDKAVTPDLKAALQGDIQGIEKKSTPYLLGVMNLLLHGIERPNLAERNALQTNIKLIQDGDRVEVIATNPPFGGAEEQGILHNFPDGLRTQETALLFFQYVMAMLKRPGGRCGVVLPNGFLFGGGVALEIKKTLLERFNLHTIVRLPNGTFAPYTGIPTNLLFFEASAGEEQWETPCTREVWFYELPLPEGRSSYSKTKPLQFEEFADCQRWWERREEPNERAWRVSYAEIAARDFNLDWKNPNRQEDARHLPPEQLVESILKKEARIQELLGEIKAIVARGLPGEE
jgi:type I restriction enzyme M protein